VSESWRTDRPPVLVVSDDPDAGELLSRLLERDGWPVGLAISGAGGLTALCDADGWYAVVVVELDAAPAMQLLASIRDTPAVAGTRVILCAGPYANRGGAWIAGTDGYLVHPFGAAHFLAEVAAVVARPDSERHDHRQRQIGLPDSR
jgi:DNA-binding response OmpR family regulator